MLCDIGYVIVDHVPAMMQLMTNELTQYSMELLTTKCLNTAVMMWYLFLGERDDAMKQIGVCRSQDVTARGDRARRELNEREFAQSDANPLNVLDSLAHELLSTPATNIELKCNTKSLFYVILTDGNLPKVIDTDDGDVKVNVRDTEWFPGHVFVVEKACHTRNRNRYNLYQSYVNNYTLRGYSVFNKSFSMSHEIVRDMVESLRSMYTSSQWDERHTSFWKRFAHVDTRMYEGHQFSRVSFMCYQKANTTQCVEHLRIFVSSRRDMLLKRLKEGELNEDEPYGNKDLYTGSQIKVAVEILSNRQMLNEMNAVLAKI
jgi:hypothetical protein